MNLKLDDKGKLGGFVDWAGNTKLKTLLPGITVYNTFDLHTKNNT